MSTDSFTKEERTLIAIGQDIAEEHTKRTGRPYSVIPARDPVTGVLHICFAYLNTDNYPYILGSCEVFPYTEDEYEGFQRRQKSDFPRGPMIRK